MMLLSSLPMMPTGMWDDDDVKLFWHYFLWFVKENQVWIMTCIAFLTCVLVTYMILRVVRQDRDDDDDDYDIW